jgi:hypothetical protein
VCIRDSIVHAARGRPAIASECCFPAHADLTIERSTILGHICLQQISRAEDSLFAGIVHVQRRSHGYMRFCFVPTEPSHLPRLSDRAGWSRLIGVLKCGFKKILSEICEKEFPYTEADCCVLFRTPPRFKCQPDSAAAVAHTGASPAADCGCEQSTPDVSEPESDIPGGTTVIPTFVSTRFGQPGYCELALDCPREILRGADDESELGVFHDNYWPQRSASLEARLQEYTPAEMESSVIYADGLISPVVPRRPKRGRSAS